MKENELTYNILLLNGFNESENEVYECFLGVTEPLDTGDTDVYYRRLYMYYNYLEWRWSVWYLDGEGKRHLGYCQTVEQLNGLLQKNNIDKEITIKKWNISKAEKCIEDNTTKLLDLDGKANFVWLTPNDARKAVEIAREEIYEWLNKELPTYIDYRCRGVGESVEEFVDDLKQAMKDGKGRR